MGITSPEERTIDRLAALESRFEALVVQDRPGSKAFTSGRIPFGSPTGVLTESSDLVWDNTNKRLGIGTSSPAARAHIAATSGSGLVLSRIERTNANADTLFDIYNSDHSIGSGSNFRLTRTDTTTYEHVRGDGFFGVFGPMQIRDTTFIVPTKTHLHVSSQSRYGIRVATGSTGGAMVQDILTTNTGFDRAFFGHNAIWNDSDQLWYVDNIGANDATGMLIENGGQISFINHVSTGASSRTITHANFLAQTRLALTSQGVMSQVVLDAATSAQSAIYNAFHRSTATPATGFGSQMQWLGDTDSGADRGMLLLRTQWSTVTDASRKALGIFYIADTAFREIWRGEASGTAAMIGFLGANASIRQTSGANLTNNVTAGGTTDQIDNWTNLATYSTDAAAIRNAVYQLARKLKQVNDALRLYGLLT